MTRHRYWWLGGIAAVAMLLGVALAVPVWAAPSGQTEGPAPDVYTAMHDECEGGDVQGMVEAMDALTDDDWDAMGGHMSDGHYGTMGSSMMRIGVMRGGISATEDGGAEMMSFW